MHLSQLVHIEGEGWLILSDITNRDYVFLSVNRYKNAHRTVRIKRNEFPHKESKTCDVRHTELSDINELFVGKEVFFFGSIRDIVVQDGARLKELARKVNFGKITKIDFKNRTAEIDGDITVRLFTIIAHDHNFEQLINTNAKICGICQAIYTPLSMAN